MDSGARIQATAAIRAVMVILVGFGYVVQSIAFVWFILKEPSLEKGNIFTSVWVSNEML